MKRYPSIFNFLLNFSYSLGYTEETNYRDNLEIKLHDFLEF